MTDGFPTGFQKLETFVEALQHSELVILVVPSAMEQASLVHSIALNIATGGRRGVALFSPGMNKHRLTQRLLSMSTGIEVHRLQTGQLSDEERRRVMAKASILSTMSLWIDDTSDLSIKVLRQRVQHLAERHDVALVVVDHVYLLQLSVDGTKDRDLWQEVYEVSRSLKALAHDLRIPIVAVAPLLHDIEHRRHGVLQHAGRPDRLSVASLEHFLFLRRDEPSSVEPTNSGFIIATLLITKQQDGRVTELEISSQADRSKP
jgi:replicative DNA helicase